MALSVSALALALAATWAQRFRLEGAETIDHSPSGHWPTPAAALSSEGSSGPVMITVEYRIEENNRPLFLALMQDLGERRRRDGAVQWALVEDTAQPGEFLEYFLVGTWLEHLRQHERVTREEERLQAALRTLHRGGQPPRVRHLVVAGAQSPSPPPPHGGDA